MQTIRRTLTGSSRQALIFAIRLNVYGVGLAALWTTLNSIILPDRVDALVGPSLRGTGLGIISLIGIGAAAIFQPIAGYLSDRSRLPDRRRPFIVGGSAVVLAGMALFGLAGTFGLLLIAYVLMQLSANVAQAAFQALIPDLVLPAERGVSSGVKNGLNVIGTGLGLLGTQAVIAATGQSRLALIFLGVVLATCAVAVWIWVPAVPPDRNVAGDRRPSIWAGLRELVGSSVAAFRRSPSFSRAVLAQFLFLLGTYPLQRFLVYYLEDRFHLDNALRSAGGYLAVAILLGIAAAPLGGILSDDIGRLPVLRWSVGLGGAGVLVIALAPDVALATIGGALVAVGTGAFLAVNWALISEDIPDGKGAQYFALANIATAGSSALAGLTGPIADGFERILPGNGYSIAFVAAAVICLAALWPLHGARRPPSQMGGT